MAITPAEWLSNSTVAYRNCFLASAGWLYLMRPAETHTALTPAEGRLCMQQQDVRRGMPAPKTSFMLLPGSAECRVAQSVANHSDTIQAYLVWPIDKTDCDDELDLVDQAMNQFGLVYREVLERIRTGTTFPRGGRLSYEPPARTSDKSKHPGCWDATLTINWDL